MAATPKRHATPRAVRAVHAAKKADRMPSVLDAMEPAEAELQYGAQHGSWCVLEAAKARDWAACVALASVHPDACEAKDPFFKGYLPLHYADEYDAPVEVIAALLRAFPGGARDAAASAPRRMYFAHVLSAQRGSSSTNPPSLVAWLLDNQSGPTAWCSPSSRR